MQNEMIDKLSDKIGIYVIQSRFIDNEGKECVVNRESMVLIEKELDSFMKKLLNTPNSEFYFDYKDHFLVKIGEYSLNDLDVHLCTVPLTVQPLSYYVNFNLRKYQQLLLTLNTLPSGYYKMPKEMKDSIQEKIDDSIVEFVRDFVIPEIDLDKIKSHKNQLLDTINDVATK